MGPTYLSVEQHQPTQHHIVCASSQTDKQAQRARSMDFKISVTDFNNNPAARVSLYNRAPRALYIRDTCQYPVAIGIIYSQTRGRLLRFARSVTSWWRAAIIWPTTDSHLYTRQFKHIYCDLRAWPTIVNFTFVYLNQHIGHCSTMFNVCIGYIFPPIAFCYRQKCGIKA